MKIDWLLRHAVIFLSIFSLKSEFVEKALMELVTVLSELTEIDVFIHSRLEPRDFDITFILENLWKHNQIKVKISKDSLNNEDKTQLCLMIFETGEDFVAFFGNSTVNPLNIHSFFIVILTGSDETAEQKLIFNKAWEKSLYNFDVLIKTNDDSVRLFTFFPLKKNNCNDTEPTSINEFFNGTWKTREFFPEKFSNFNRCPVKIGTPEAPLAFSKITHEDGTVDFVGSDAEIVKILEDSMNFTARINSSGELNGWGDIAENGTATGVIRQILNGDSDLLMGYFLRPIRSLHMKNSDVYFFIPICVFVPPGAPYTSFENLFRPFSLMLIQDLIFENDVKNSFYNLLMIIVGGSMEKLPKKNFPRILVMTFILFCLVMRTIYQSRMFEFLQAGDNKKMVSTMKEMVEKEFDFYLYIMPDDPIASVLSYPEE
jgi:hypothetical protein